MGVAYISPMTVFILLINKNFKLKNLFAKVEKILTFFSLTFFNLQLRVHNLVIISKLYNNNKNKDYFCI